MFCCVCCFLTKFSIKTSIFAQKHKTVFTIHQHQNIIRTPQPIMLFCLAPFLCKAKVIARKRKTLNSWSLKTRKMWTIVKLCLIFEKKLLLYVFQNSNFAVYDDIFATNKTLRSIFLNTIGVATGS